MEVTSEHSIHELHFVVSTYKVYFFFKLYHSCSVNLTMGSRWHPQLLFSGLFFTICLTIISIIISIVITTTILIRHTPSCKTFFLLMTKIMNDGNFRIATQES